MIFLSLSAHFHTAQSDFLSLRELTFPDITYVGEERTSSPDGTPALGLTKAAG